MKVLLIIIIIINVISAINKFLGVFQGKDARERFVYFLGLGFKILTIYFLNVLYTLSYIQK